MAADLTTTMDTLTECVCTALETAGRPACDCGLTIGVPAQGPAGCCEDCGGVGGNVATFLERVYPVDPTTYEQVVRREDCKPGAVAADISVTLVRCYPSMDAQGRMPSLETTTEYAHNLNTDIAAVWAALKCCDTPIVFRDSAIQGDPEGGCAGFVIRVSVLVSMAAPEPVDPS
jgi:hypothetical protein